MRTLVAVPCMDNVAAPFAHSLSSMKNEGECFISFIIGSLIYESRNNFCKQALKTKADYVLWLDSDMVFESDVMERMHRHMEDGKDIVSGLYFRRRAPFTPVLYKELGGNGSYVEYPDYPKDSVFEIGGCGFGCVMLKREVIEAVAFDSGNWFEPCDGYGEDLSFCVRAKRAGFKIWCDSTIKCGHVGQLIINEDIYESMGKRDA